MKKLKVVLEVFDSVFTKYPETAEYIKNEHGGGVCKEKIIS